MKLSSLRITAILMFALMAMNLTAQDTSKYPPQRLTHHMTPEEALNRHLIGKGFVETAPPTGTVTSIAEFERSKGVLVRYPFGIPVALIKEMAADAIVTTLVTGAAQENTVRSTYTSAGVNLANCTFIYAPTDSYWTRDYSPWYITYGDNQIGIVDFPYNRPRPNDNNVPAKVSAALGLEMFGMNVVQTGGNFMSDGYGMGASTTIAYTENPTQTPAQVDQKVLNFLGVSNYQVLPDPNNTYIDHIDCWGKYLSPNKVLIRAVPTTHAQYNELEAMAAYFANLITPWGVPYTVYRVNTPYDQPYSNSFILNHKVFVPIMGGSSASFDEAALEVYRQAMPGYQIFGVIGQPSTPWQSTDALHCRTHEMGDTEMLSIKHFPLLSNVQQAESYTLEANIIAYSGAEIIADSVLLYYRVNPNIHSPFQAMNMTHTSGTKWSASIPSPEYGSTIQYYLHAADASGRSENYPFIGQPDPYVFYVGEQLFANASIDTPAIEKSVMRNEMEEVSMNLSNTGGLGLNYFITVSTNRPDTLSYTLSNSPAATAYNSNTFTELAWTTLAVSAEGALNEIIVRYTWTTDNHSSEGSFWAESPAGVKTKLASAQNSGTYTISNKNLAGEELTGNWKFWIEDSYGDGGHQAKDISVKFVRVVPTGNWLSVDSVEGTVQPGSSKGIVVQLDATGMEVGSYQGLISILSNDAGTPELLIPVEMTVTINTAVTDNFEAKRSVKVYPNPGNGIYTIEIQGGNTSFTEAEITDLTGRVVYSAQYPPSSTDQRFTISVPQLPVGVYLLRIKSGTHQEVLKLIRN